AGRRPRCRELDRTAAFPRPPHASPQCRVDDAAGGRARARGRARGPDGVHGRGAFPRGRNRAWARRLEARRPPRGWGGGRGDGPAGSELVVRRKDRDAGGATAPPVARARLPAGTGEVELRRAIDEGTANAGWRPAAQRAWRALPGQLDVSHMASVNAGLFAG